MTHLVIKKPPFFHYKPGDYVYLNIPVIARYEWHPFTISSAPEQPGRELTVAVQPRALVLTGASAREESPPGQKRWLHYFWTFLTLPSQTIQEAEEQEVLNSQDCLSYGAMKGDPNLHLPASHCVGASPAVELSILEEWLVKLRDFAEMDKLTSLIREKTASAFIGD